MSLRLVTRGLRRLFRRSEAEAELRDEVSHYLELSVQEHMRVGLSPADAERAARVDFGGVEAAKENVRSAGWDGAIDAWRRDVAYGLRGLRRNPGFATIAVITLALGIGANTAMFSVVNAVLLRPLPYHDADRLAFVFTDDPKRGFHEEGTAFRTILDWRDGSHAFSAIGYFSAGRVTLATNGQRERSRGASVSGNLFAVLGAAPQLGRTITLADEHDAADIAVISYSLWQRRFGGDSAAIGKTIQTVDVKGEGVLRVVGVMPRGFYFPDKTTELWTPATLYWRFNRESTERFPSWVRRWTGIARLAPGVSLDVARTDLDRVGQHLAAVHPSNVPDFPGFGTTVTRVIDHVARRDLRAALWVLLSAVGLVLVVACANVANLLLARGATRQREIAIRRALGASRARVVRQLVAESMALATIGGALGVFVAWVGVRTLVTISAARVPRIEETSLDMRVLAFAVLVSVVSGLLFGIAPAFRLSSGDANRSLKEGGHTTGGVHLRRARGALVVVECALAVVLLAGAGLLLRSLARLNGVDAGFDSKHVLAVRIEFPPERPATAEERRLGVMAEIARAQGRDARLVGLEARLAALPGVQSVGFTDDMFISGQAKPDASITLPGHDTDSLAAGELNDGAASPSFFATMRVPLRRGRVLTHDDVLTKIRALYAPVVNDRSLADKERLSVPEPVVVNDAFVRRFFPTEDPLGKRFCIDPTNKTYWYVIVGVMGDMHRQGLERRAIPEYFGPYLPSPTGRFDAMVRVNGDPLALARSVREAVAAEIPGALIPTVSTVEQQLGDFSAERNFQTWLLALFAALALVLAAVGIYGVVRYSVAERTREMGVRVALGASPSALVGQVVRDGMLMPLAGMLIGATGALAATRFMSHLLFGVGSADPLTFAGVVVSLVLVAFVACVIPARRAASIDPMIALRHE